MAKITLNGREIEVAEGRPLVEVIKEQGVAITNLCYIDGLDPYAGCRTCLVNIEGAPGPPGIQLSCTARTVDGMSVDTDTAVLRQAKQQVLSIIDANHPDRCLTCHRRVHCMPGDICLRDDVVSHRCLTCAKNYRCELQMANEMLDMGEFEEPWVGEQRSYYETAPPYPDRANPFLEFDPQMCIICTRCVRACAERHTDAISLAGRGFQVRIAFGTGGAVHESDCDFCGACIDVCPTATLMEKPNKWVGRADDWTAAACNSCSVGCTIAYGTAGGRPVIVRPDRMNPVSRDQICVRGRFGYTAITEGERLTRSLARRGEHLLPVATDEAIEEAATALAGVRREHGSDAIAVLGSPLATNEECYLLARLARETLGTQHIDFSHGPLHRAVCDALAAGLGDAHLPASLTDIESAQTIVVVGSDIEESHQIISLRVKDAVKKHGARLILVSPRWGELAPFATAWLQPAPGHEAAAVQALARSLAGDDALAAAAPEGVAAEALAAAIEAVTAGRDAEGHFAIVFAPDGGSTTAAAGQARACANLAIAARGDQAPSSLHYLPADANTHGASDMGVAPGDGGRSFEQIIEAARNREIRALVIHDDNPLLNAPGRDDIAAALEALDVLVVIDSVRSTAAEHANVVLAELPFFGRSGTITNADRRIIRSNAAAGPRADERTGIALISALANALQGVYRYESAAEVMAEAAERVSAYVPYPALTSARTRAIEDGTTSSTKRPDTAYQSIAAAPAAAGGLAVMTGRSLFTSWDGASMRSESADQLHREQSAVINPRDAEAAGVRDGDEFVLSDGTHELRISARLDDGVAPGSVYVPHYFDGGAVMAFFPLDGGAAAAPRVQLRALQPA